MTEEFCPINSVHIIPSSDAENSTHTYVDLSENFKIGFSKIALSYPLN